MFALFLQSFKRSGTLVYVAFDNDVFFAQPVYCANAEFCVQEAQKLSAVCRYIIESQLLFFRTFADDFFELFKCFGIVCGEKFPCIFGVFFFSELLRNKQTQHIDIAQIVRLAHKVHKSQLFGTYGRIEVLRSFKVGKFRFFFFAYNEADKSFFAEFNDNSASDGNVVALVVESPVHVAVGYIDDDFEYHKAITLSRMMSASSLLLTFPLSTH